MKPSGKKVEEREESSREREERLSVSGRAEPFENRGRAVRGFVHHVNQRKSDAGEGGDVGGRGGSG